MLPEGPIVGQSPDVPPVRPHIGGKKMKVWLSVVTVVAAVTLGTRIVTVPLMMITELLETTGSPLGPVHVVAGRVIPGELTGVVVANVVPGAFPLVDGSPMVVPGQSR